MAHNGLLCQSSYVLWTCLNALDWMPRARRLARFHTSGILYAHPPRTDDTASSSDAPRATSASFVVR